MGRHSVCVVDAVLRGLGLLSPTRSHRGSLRRNARLSLSWVYSSLARMRAAATLYLSSRDAYLSLNRACPDWSQTACTSQHWICSELQIEYAPFGQAAARIHLQAFGRSPRSCSSYSRHGAGSGKSGADPRTPWSPWRVTVFALTSPSRCS